MIPPLYAAVFALGVLETPFYGAGRRYVCEGCGEWFWAHEQHNFAACVAAKEAANDEVSPSNATDVR